MQRAFRDVEHLAQVVIIQQPVAVGQNGETLLRGGRAQLFDVLQPLGETLHPTLEILPVQHHGRLLFTQVYRYSFYFSDEFFVDFRSDNNFFHNPLSFCLLQRSILFDTVITRSVRLFCDKIFCLYNDCYVDKGVLAAIKNVNSCRNKANTDVGNRDYGWRKPSIIS